LSFGPSNRDEDADAAIAALGEILQGAGQARTRLFLCARPEISPRGCRP
jgi:hypothetical protein